MSPADIPFVEKELHMDREELLSIIAQYRRREQEQKALDIENQNAITAMHRDYHALKEENASLKKENEELKKQLLHIVEQNRLKTRTIFGRGTEKLSDIADAQDSEELVDEAQEEPELKRPTGNVRDNSKAAEYRKKHSSGKRKGKRKEDLDALPQRNRFLLDADKLDETYGKGKWKVFAWRQNRTMEVDPKVCYTMNTFIPVIRTGMDEPSLVTAKNPYALLPGSFVSASLMADILYQRFRCYLPTYRQEQSLSDFGCRISRQTITNWIIHFAQTMFYPVYRRLQSLLLEVPYHQCDETGWRVLRDDRPAGSRSYLWAHMTSEHYSTEPIILFCYELTRGTDHLREFYRDFEGFITCDAYISYQTLGKENLDVITVCGCMMHLRRRFAYSLLLQDTRKLSDEELQSLPEMKALVLIGRIYDADESLKHLSAPERYAARQEKVKPLMEEYFSFVDELETDERPKSERLEDAIQYSKNQKEYLCRFLKDGNIPIDNGSCERHIRPLTLLRSASLFSTSIDGAEAVAIMASIAETAKANKANVYWYFRYILEMMPRHLDDKNLDFLEDMLPWSEKYREYENQRVSGTPPDPPDIYEDRPGMPEIKGLQKKATA